MLSTHAALLDIARIADFAIRLPPVAWSTALGGMRVRFGRVSDYALASFSFGTIWRWFRCMCELQKERNVVFGVHLGGSLFEVKLEQ